MPAQYIQADPHVWDVDGRVALTRGPLVYCLEGRDHGGSLSGLRYCRDALYQPVPGDGVLAGEVLLTGPGAHAAPQRTASTRPTPGETQACQPARNSLFRLEQPRCRRNGRLASVAIAPSHRAALSDGPVFLLKFFSLSTEKYDKMESGKEYLVRPSCRRKDAPMKTVLFVCTGNTCRSPMAECLFNALAREQGAPACAPPRPGCALPTARPRPRGRFLPCGGAGCRWKGTGRAP